MFDFLFFEAIILVVDSFRKKIGKSDQSSIIDDAPGEIVELSRIKSDRYNQ